MRHGTSRRQRIGFSPSEHLQHLRVARRHAVEQHMRKNLTLQIGKIHRQELKRWKSIQLNAFLGNPSRWKDLRDYLQRPSGRRSVIYPQMHDFASTKRGRPSIRWDDILTNFSSEFFDNDNWWHVAREVSSWFTSAGFYVQFCRAHFGL